MRRATIAAVLLLAVGCGQPPWAQSERDLENVEVRDPASATIYNNVDGRPNIVRLCTDGVSWATTTRDLQALVRVPEWDDECPEDSDPIVRPGRPAR